MQSQLGNVSSILHIEKENLDIFSWKDYLHFSLKICNGEFLYLCPEGDVQGTGLIEGFKEL